MAKNVPRKNTYKNTPKQKKKASAGSRFKLNMQFNWFSDRRFQLVLGLLLMGSALFLFFSFFSYLFTGTADQSVIEAAGETELREAGAEIRNWLGLGGAWLAYTFMFSWFGVAAFFIPPVLFVLGYKIVLRRDLIHPFSLFKFSFFLLFWLSTLLGYVVMRTESLDSFAYLSGGVGYELALLFDDLFGWGTFIILFLSLLAFVIFFFNVTSVAGLNERVKTEVAQAEDSLRTTVGELVAEDEKEMPVQEEEEEPPFEPDEEEEEPEDEDDGSAWEVVEKKPAAQPQKEPAKAGNTLDFEVEDRTGAVQETEEEGPGFEIEEELSDEAQEVLEQENYDPTLDLPSYQYPHVDLLEAYDTGKVKVTEEELRSNKDKIVETLINFKIEIESIKATIGPTVTLYEIVPKPGVKISKIKNLEDDIALSLAALGIRIIAPIPGKGTIGIEVPNKSREMVSMRSVMTTDKFMRSNMELPIVLGKTISNEVFVTDLAKMPHLLIAGATGQGKSVGLNVLLASLLYKKHPSQLKLVLVDPKKVELTLFNKIERHFLAMLPDGQDAIITDTSKVVNTLNSLCIEMDARYDLLKDAACRNLKEYNAKFVQRKLSPEKGHRFLPYIVLVIDELADLMMTAGKEVETPIARLAQLARAIGIHLVVATQRPSVNVITGIIKANFPARLSFRVTSKIDSRTILDTGGAEQLVGQGDMLLSHGSDLIRLQCAFLDTPEVDNICEFIGSQRGYSSAYMLPEYVGEGEDKGIGEVDLAERDAMFDDAARLIVRHQQGSTSLIQRKLKLGYNRAGRLIDQLEAAGIVGAFEGSKAREVLIPDEYSLEQLLNNLTEKRS